MKDIEIDAKDFFARTIQHEVDHLNGVLYVDRVTGKLYDESDFEKSDDKDEN